MAYVLAFACVVHGPGGPQNGLIRVGWTELIQATCSWAANTSATVQSSKFHKHHYTISVWYYLIIIRSGTLDF